MVRCTSRLSHQATTSLATKGGTTVSAAPCRMRTGHRTCMPGESARWPQGSLLPQDVKVDRSQGAPRATSEVLNGHTQVFGDPRPLGPRMTAESLQGVLAWASLRPTSSRQ
jgi:hypothetical protein